MEWPAGVLHEVRLCVYSAHTHTVMEAQQCASGNPGGSSRALRNTGISTVSVFTFWLRQRTKGGGVVVERLSVLQHLLAECPSARGLAGMLPLTLFCPPRRKTKQGEVELFVRSRDFHNLFSEVCGKLSVGVPNDIKSYKKMSSLPPIYIKKLTKLN